MHNKGKSAPRHAISLLHYSDHLFMWKPQKPMKIGQKQKGKRNPLWEICTTRKAISNTKGVAFTGWDVKIKLDLVMEREELEKDVQSTVKQCLEFGNQRSEERVTFPV